MESWCIWTLWRSLHSYTWYWLALQGCWCVTVNRTSINCISTLYMGRQNWRTTLLVWFSCVECNFEGVGAKFEVSCQIDYLFLTAMAEVDMLQHTSLWIHSSFISFPFQWWIKPPHLLSMASWCSYLPDLIKVQWFPCNGLPSLSQGQCGFVHLHTQTLYHLKLQLAFPEWSHPQPDTDCLSLPPWQLCKDCYLPVMPSTSKKKNNNIIIAPC